MSFEDHLINEVQKYPVLYDVNNQYYYDAVRKENAWKEIGKNLNQPADVVKKRWTSLRDCFRKALIKRNSEIRRGKKVKPWKYDAQMSFLKAHFVDRIATVENTDDSNKEKVKIEKYENSNEETNYGNNQDLLLRQDIILPGEDHSRSQFASSSQDGPSPKNPYVPSIVSVAPVDHIQSFFKAMEDTVRTFSPILQVEVKSKISALVSEYELKNVTASTSRNSYEFVALPAHPTSFASVQYSP